MHVVALPARPRGLSLMLNWGRVRFTLLLSLFIAFLFSFRYPGGFWPAVTSTALVALTAMLVFGLFEQWPGWISTPMRADPSRRSGWRPVPA